MRISDWSSDVCSSDLDARGRQRRMIGVQRHASSGLSGSDRRRMPVAAWMALAIAGATAGTPSSPTPPRSEEHTSELQSLMRISYAVFCLKKKKKKNKHI